MTYMDYAPPKIIPPTNQDNNAIVDSGNNGHYILDESVCMNLKLTKSLLSVALPDGSQIKLTHTDMLLLTNLPKSEQHTQIFPELK